MSKAVIFDMNGVIINDERLHQESWRRLSQKYGWHITEADFEKNVFGRTEAETLTYVLQRRLEPGDLAKYSTERVAIVRELAKTDLVLTQGLLPFLKDLHSAKIPLGIATSSRKPYADHVVDSFNIRNFFTAIVTAEDIQHGKPDPEIYLLAASKLATDPKDCLAFEDSFSGIQAAQSAGIQTIALTSTHSAEELKMADGTINTFNDISVEHVQER